MVDVLIWNIAVNQECSGGSSSVKQSGQSRVQVLKFYTVQFNAVYLILEHSGQSGVHV